MPPPELAPTGLAGVTDMSIVPALGAATFAALPEAGYQLGQLIGRGGMGEVVVAQDQRIGREVAIKRIRDDDPSTDQVLRFLREARIQARLDHPAIVPVYELGVDSDGRLYFTMKRIGGETLASKLLQGAPMQPLLRAFVDVCQAIQLAHARGVVHRDLKPSNIMLGDYGEVYVLDWGVARVLTDTRRSMATISAHVDDATTAGAILGTPGYMAPEQVRGEDVDTKADVYALGTILFEILAGETLHPRGEAALSSTLARPQEAPAQRVAERRQIPLELDSVCFEALAEQPAERPTARELADRVQAYLDGDRDTEARRAGAAAELTAAREALAADPIGGRAIAVRRASRALALDPDSTEATELVASLLVEPPPPSQYAPELVAYLSQEEGEVSSRRSYQAVALYLSLFAFWLVFPFLEIKSWGTLIALYALLGAGALFALRSARTGQPNIPVTLAISALTPIVFARLTGPLVLTPILVCAALMHLVAIRYIADRPWIVVGWGLVVVLAPFVLEWSGLLSRTFAVESGRIVGTSAVFELRGAIDEIVLAGANLLFLLMTSVTSLMISRNRLRAQRQLQVQAWHMSHMVPAARRWPVRATPSPPP